MKRAKVAAATAIRRGPKKTSPRVRRPAIIPEARRVVTEKYPYTALLAKKKYYGEVQVVSPDLCDDILSYIGPSLEKHKHCDIIDINPGIGLWSRKVHELLQPRTHLLLEPNMDDYSEFLNPLLSQPNSRYRHVSNNIYQFEAYDKLFKDGYLPEQITPAPGDPQLREQNNSLLIIGNLAYDPVKEGFGFTSMARQMTMRFCTDIARNAMFHQAGPVRMLLWTNEADKPTILPRSVGDRGRYSLTMEKVASIHEVSSSGKARSIRGKSVGYQREPELNLESSLNVLRAMKEAGLELPSHRRDPVHQEAIDQFESDLTDSGDLSENGGSVTEKLHGYGVKGLEEFTELKKKYESGQLEQYIKNGAINPQWERYHYLLGRNKFYKGRKSALDSVHQQADKVLQLEIQMTAASTPESEKAVIQEQLDAANKELVDKKSKLLKGHAASLDLERDNRVGLRLGPRRLMWDRRPYEPLVSFEEEFWPTGQISLFDFQPRTGLDLPSNTDLEFLMEFLTHLYTTSSLPITRALEQLAPGAAEAIVQKVPEMKDPMKGGRLNPNDLSVRTLTAEMFDGILEAWKNWPFAPPGSDNPGYWKLRSGLAAKADAWQTRNW